MKTDVQANQSAIADFVEGTVISVATPFVALSSKYALQTVNGYETEKVLPPTPEVLKALYTNGEARDFDDMADWVLANAIPGCIENTLSKLEYYVVVVGVARNGNIRSEKKGGVQFQPFDIGIGSVTIEELGRVQTVSTNRVFAISGRLYRKNRETIHAMH